MVISHTRSDPREVVDAGQQHAGEIAPLEEAAHPFYFPIDFARELRAGNLRPCGCKREGGQQQAFGEAMGSAHFPLIVRAISGQPSAISFFEKRPSPWAEG